MRLRTTGDLQKAIDTLTSLARELKSLLNDPNLTSRQARYDWLQWWANADMRLRDVFARGDLQTALYVTAADVRTSEPRQPASVTSGHDAPTLSFIIRCRDVWAERLEDEARELRQVQAFVDRPGRIGVLDTSAFIEGRKFWLANWPTLLGADPPGGPPLPVRLVVPLLVVEELDEGKTSKVNRVQDRSRDSLRELWKLDRDSSLSSRLVDVLRLNSRVTIEILLDSRAHNRLPVNDFEITDRAVFVQEMVSSPRQVQMVAGDYSMLVRARSMGLHSVLIPRLESGDGGEGASAHSTS